MNEYTCGGRGAQTLPLLLPAEREKQAGEGGCILRLVLGHLLSRKKPKLLWVLLFRFYKRVKEEEGSIEERIKRERN